MHDARHQDPEQHDRSARATARRQADRHEQLEVAQPDRPGPERDATARYRRPGTATAAATAGRTPRRDQRVLPAAPRTSSASGIARQGDDVGQQPLVEVRGEQQDEGDEDTPRRSRPRDRRRRTAAGRRAQPDGTETGRRRASASRLAGPAGCSSSWAGQRAAIRSAARPQPPPATATASSSEDGGGHGRAAASAAVPQRPPSTGRSAPHPSS